MGRIEGRRIGMGEAKNGISKQKMDQEKLDELWAEVREMGIDELVWERKLEERLHQCNSCRNSLRECMRAWEGVKSSDLRLDKSLGMRE